MVDKLREVVAEVQSARKRGLGPARKLSASSQRSLPGSSEQAAGCGGNLFLPWNRWPPMSQNSDNAQQTRQIALKAATMRNRGEACQGRDGMKIIAQKVTIVQEIARRRSYGLNAAIEAAGRRARQGFRRGGRRGAQTRRTQWRGRRRDGNCRGSSVAVAEQAGTMFTKLIPDIKARRTVDEIAASSTEQNEGSSRSARPSASWIRSCNRTPRPARRWPRPPKNWPDRRNNSRPPSPFSG